MKFKVLFNNTYYSVRCLKIKQEGGIYGVQFRYNNDLRYKRMDSGEIELYMLKGYDSNNNEFWERILS